MAKKSKTQKAKASAARAQKRAEQENAESKDKAVVEAKAAETEKPKRSLFKKSEDSSADEKKPAKKEEKPAKKEEKKGPKKPNFLIEVRNELRRVTWPTKQDVLRWSLVVLGALVFFGVYVLVLDNGIVTPVLVAISGLGA